MPGQPAIASKAISKAAHRESRRHGELAGVYALVADDFAAVNELIPRQLTSDVTLVEDIGRYIVDSGGKRLRPLMVLLGAGACGYDGRDHVRLAAVIEFLHTATLLHDDVVDHSELRRGRATANATWGNATSVLVGDFM
jgi:octaprenyl-diphosphate synthase